MRHSKKSNHLGRTASHRDAVLINMAVSLIIHKGITTTLVRAGALKKHVEPLITRPKGDTTSSRHVVFHYLQKKEAVIGLYKTVTPRVGNHPGGYTRVIKLGTRQGDAAQIAFIELVDFDDNVAKTEKTTKKTRRSRRPSGEKNDGAIKANSAVGTGDVVKAETAEETSREASEAKAKKDVSEATAKEDTSETKARDEKEAK